MPEIEVEVFGKEWTPRVEVDGKQIPLVLGPNTLLENRRGEQWTVGDLLEQVMGIEIDTEI